MCGRYYIAEDDAAEELMEIIEAVSRKNSGVKTRGEICPSDTVPVIANNRNMEPAPFAMKWGYTLSNGGLIINARSETAAYKPLFEDGIRQRRCLIPATHYFEWDRNKLKYAIRHKKEGVMYLAGLYRFEERQPVFTILTKAPADEIAFIHNRMPVIFRGIVAKEWLSPKYGAKNMLKNAEWDVRYREA